MRYRFRFADPLKKWFHDLLKQLVAHGYVVKYEPPNHVRCLRQGDSLVVFKFSNNASVRYVLCLDMFDVLGKPISATIQVHLFTSIPPAGSSDMRAILWDIVGENMHEEINASVMSMVRSRESKMKVEAEEDSFHD